ncbi:MAG: DUF3618 domain-containing protein [Dermatophilus congolensis]|nr:DUF3618 domain-containing protein [Dermatophilus congolensis]
MTHSNDPDQIRADIEATRADLSRNVDALGESVRPGNVARRQGQKVTGAMHDIKERIMGSDDDEYAAYGEYYGQTRYVGDAGYRGDYGDDRGRAGELRDQASDQLHRAQNAVAGAPAATRRKTQGNPIAAGLIAFGAGWLLGSLLPSSQREQEAAVALKERAQPLVDEAKHVAQEAGEHLREPAQQAADSLKATATDAVENVKGEGQAVASDVQGSAKDSAANVKATRDN